jgi:uncharacterized lipoprotein
MKITSLVLLSGIAALALLAGCSKPSVPEPAAATDEDSMERAAGQAAEVTGRAGGHIAELHR